MTPRIKKWVFILLLILAGGFLFAAGFLYSLLYYETRVYLKSGFWDGDEYEKANITNYIEEGATYVIDEVDGRREDAIRLKSPPLVTNQQTLLQINKAMVRVGNLILPEESRGSLQKFNSAGNLKYLETYASDSQRLIHVYLTEFKSPSGQIIYLYPQVEANDNGLFPPMSGKYTIGKLSGIWECFARYHPCPDYINNSEYDFSFLLQPDSY